ncbi:hypothetical protein TVAG_390580 [Trichomonas vaginalis G3]|uniref:Uncharacterized protein n=1 Tax=Trichomonas vaginalis (strain ATCC PRA-98 / G3) TaxID=412133 RepID=A2ESW2_TRIV3|nr:mutated in bladder cancer 1 family [Trichomonas vaginalis G3]EAY04288.1 hypothetical protein TVAG_390580 [Trichomonas vaginalis G3]KAI5549381.1 mutated in bladder cancer 1 family [Trichomonas vaginalis G3]|eukprot:XP_001316511.1 hypothetical protein [Trichomonas vaginalis G3]
MSQYSPPRQQNSPQSARSKPRQPRIFDKMQDDYKSVTSERGWIARCNNLVQTRKDIMKQLSTNFERTADLFNKDEHDRLLNCFKLFKEPDENFYQQYNQLNMAIINLKPHERTFKNKLERIEKEITQTRVQSAALLEKINGNIKSIFEDIDARNKRTTEIQTPAIRPKLTAEQFDSPINEFYNFVNRFGHSGGWDSRSHTEFLLQLQIHGPDNLADFLPNVDKEAVKAHIEWNNEYQKLKVKMKQALNEIRQNKMKNDIVERSSPKVDPEIVKQRLAEREEQKRKQAELEAQREDEIRRQRERERRQKFEELQQKVKARKPKPIVEAPIEEVDLRPKQRFSTSDWERIRRRNDEIEEKKKEIKLQQELEAEARAEKERKLAEKNAKKYSHVKRDPERLMKPTSAMGAKEKKPDDEKNGPVNSVFDIPHRAVPMWLQ